MRIIRYSKNNEPARFGWVLDDKVGGIEGSPLDNYRRLEARTPLEEVSLKPPINPSKIICIGRNYVAHAQEHKVEVPEVPMIFLKPPSALIGPNEKIILPPHSKRVEHEAELVVVIGKKGRWILPEEAQDYILGYTIGNDVTARDLQHRDGQWTRAKGFDTFCPIGPWLETDFDPADAMITCSVNGETRQMASTHDMVFDVSQIIAFTSSIMTLNPGDILFTGTPAGVSQIQAGDIIEITIDGIGTLRNSVVEEHS